MNNTSIPVSKGIIRLRIDIFPFQIRTQLRDTPTLVPHVLRELFALRGLSCCNRLLVSILLLFAIVYLISPIDLLPELILGPFGYIDDVVSIAMALVYVVQIYRQDIMRRTL